MNQVSEDPGSPSDFWAAKDLLATGRARRTRRHGQTAFDRLLPVGRIGALAVSLGIGLAVTNAPAIALASTESGADSSSSEGAGSGASDNKSESKEKAKKQSTDDADQGSESSAEKKAAEKEQRANDAADEHDTPSGDDDSTPDPKAVDATPDDGVDAAADAEADSPSANDHPDDDDLDAAPGDAGLENPGPAEEVTAGLEVPAPESAAPVTSESAAPSAEADAPAAKAKSVAEVSPLAAKVTLVDHSLSSVVEVAPIEAAKSLVAEDVTAVAKVADVEPDEAPAAVAVAEPAALVAVAPTAASVSTVTDVISSIVSILVNSVTNPSEPTDTPWLSALLAWVRREINHTFFNHTPVMGNIETTQVLSGLVIDLNATDPDGDPLNYTITQQPEHGTVVFEPITQKFIYVPNSLVPTSDVVDSFQVTISDHNQVLTGALGDLQASLHSLAQSLGWADPDTLVVTVPVHIEAVIELSAPAVVVTSVIPPVFTVGGSPVTVASSVLVEDLDSDYMSGATVSVSSGFQSGDTLNYVAPDENPITGTYDSSTGVLTLTGTGTKAQYEAALAAVTFSTTAGAFLDGRVITFAVTDEDGNASVSLLVNDHVLVGVVAAPKLPPAVLVVTAAPVFTVGGSPVTLVSSVTVEDLDSDYLSGATVSVSSGFKSGDELGYVAPSGNPITGTYDSSTGVLTLTGTGTKAQYEAALAAVTFSTTAGAFLDGRAVTFAVTDEDGNASISVVLNDTVAVGVVAAPKLPPGVLVVTASPVFTVGGSPVTLVSSVTVEDLDSDYLSGATVSVSSGFKSGDALGYVAPSGNPITGTYDSSTGVLTLTGTGTKAQYEAALAAVTFSTTAGAFLDGRAVTFAVTDEDGNASISVVLNDTVAVGVVEAPKLPPGALVSGAGTYRVGDTAITVFDSVEITDADSAYLSEARVSVSTNFKSGDVLSYTPPAGSPITATYDAANGVLKLTGVATLDAYEDALRAVTFTGTQGGLLDIRTVSLSIVDSTGVDGVVVGTSLISVAPNNAPVVVNYSVVGLYTAGNSAVTVDSLTTVSDDSAYLTGATVTITSQVFSGDNLTFTPSGGITGRYVNGVLTLEGNATAAQYQTVLRSVKFSTAKYTGIQKIRSYTFTFAVTDKEGSTGSSLLAPARITVNGALF